LKKPKNKPPDYQGERDAPDHYECVAPKHHSKHLAPLDDIFQDETVKTGKKLSHKRESGDFQKHKESKKKGKIRREYPAKASRNLAGKKDQQEGWQDYAETKNNGIHPHADREQKSVVWDIPDLWKEGKAKHCPKNRKSAQAEEIKNDNRTKKADETDRL
jgi:hypothetical protein